jgi:hypothetical protein
MTVGDWGEGKTREDASIRQETSRSQRLTYAPNATTRLNIMFLGLQIYAKIIAYGQLVGKEHSIFFYRMTGQINPRIDNCVVLRNAQKAHFGLLAVHILKIRKNQL